MAKILQFLLLVTLLALFLGPAPGLAERDEPVQVKFATLAPEGTTWMKVMRELAKEVEEESGGELHFRFFPGGVMGDEKDVVRKIRIGQLHSAGFSGVGLGEILPEVRILELPFLFLRYEEADFVRDRIEPRLRRGLEEKGFVLLGWAEVGFVNFFSKHPIHRREDLAGRKIFMWAGDPLAKAYFDALDLAPIPLGVPEVLTSLQTGLVDTVYTSPLAAVALQWFTRVNYMTSLPVSNATGAVLMSKKVFDELSEETQMLLMSRARYHLDRLIRLTREENDRAVLVIQKEGIELLPLPPPEELEAFLDVGRSTWDRLAGDLFPKDLLEEVLDALAEYRASSPGPSR